MKKRTTVIFTALIFVIVILGLFLFQILNSIAKARYASYEAATWVYMQDLSDILQKNSISDSELHLLTTQCIALKYIVKDTFSNSEIGKNLYSDLDLIHKKIEQIRQLKSDGKDYKDLALELSKIAKQKKEEGKKFSSEFQEKKFLILFK